MAAARTTATATATAASAAAPTAGDACRRSETRTGVRSAPTTACGRTLWWAPPRPPSARVRAPPSSSSIWTATAHATRCCWGRAARCGSRCRRRRRTWRRWCDARLRRRLRGPTVLVVRRRRLGATIYPCRRIARRRRRRPRRASAPDLGASGRGRRPRDRVHAARARLLPRAARLRGRVPRRAHVQRSAVDQGTAGYEYTVPWRAVGAYAPRPRRRRRSFRWRVRRLSPIATCAANPQKWTAAFTAFDTDGDVRLSPSGVDQVRVAALVYAEALPEGSLRRRPPRRPRRGRRRCTRASCTKSTKQRARGMAAAGPTDAPSCAFERAATAGLAGWRPDGEAVTEKRSLAGSGSRAWRRRRRRRRPTSRCIWTLSPTSPACGASCRQRGCGARACARLRSAAAADAGRRAAAHRGRDGEVQLPRPHRPPRADHAPPPPRHGRRSAPTRHARRRPRALRGVLPPLCRPRRRRQRLGLVRRDPRWRVH